MIRYVMIILGVSLLVAGCALPAYIVCVLSAEALVSGPEIRAQKPAEFRRLGLPDCEAQVCSYTEDQFAAEHEEQKWEDSVRATALPWGAGPAVATTVILLLSSFLLIRKKRTLPIWYYVVIGIIPPFFLSIGWLFILDNQKRKPPPSVLTTPKAGASAPG